MDENARLTQSASATVVALREEKRRWGSMYSASTVIAIFPTVRFENQDGRTVETEFEVWKWELPNFQQKWFRPSPKVSSFIKVGDEVTVLYDTQHPDTAVLESAERQRREDAARASKATLERSRVHRAPIVTEIRSATRLWPAEGYHQRYIQRGGPHHCNVFNRTVRFPTHRKAERLTPDK